MEKLFLIGKIFLVILAVTGVALPLISERSNYKFVWSVWRRFRIKMFFECLFILILTIFFTGLLWQIPGLKYGWINLFFGKSGNMLIKPIQEGSESTSIMIRLAVPLFFTALLVALPFLARSEERSFRMGYDEWKPIIKQSIKFGLIHCLVGVPLAAGLALIIPGLFYGFKYKRAFNRNVKILNYSQAEEEAVMVSTAYHTMYNTIVVLLLLVIAIVAV